MYFVFTFCVMVSKYQQIFRETWRIAGGGGTCYGSAVHPGGVAIPPNRPILQEPCYSTSCSPVVFFRRKRRSCSSPPAFSWRLLRFFSSWLVKLPIVKWHNVSVYSGLIISPLSFCSKGSSSWLWQWLFSILSKSWSPFSGYPIRFWHGMHDLV